MINLLPLKQQKFLKKQFTIRVFVFISGMFLAGLVLYFFALLPTYIILDSQINILEKEKKALDSLAKDDEYRLVSEKVKGINTKIVSINNFYAKRQNYLDFTNDLLAKKPSGLIINKITIVKNEDNLEGVIEGISNNREILSGYISRLRLEKTESYQVTGYEFLAVTVPIVNFTDSENIAFSFNIKYGEKK